MRCECGISILELGGKFNANLIFHPVVDLHNKSSALIGRATIGLLIDL